MNNVFCFTLAALCTFLLASCASTPPPVATSSYTAVTLERTPCFGRCPVYTVTIYGDGTVRYEGKEHVKVKGSQTRVISPDRVRQLVAEIERAGYFSLNDAYNAYMVTDAPSAITSVTVEGRTKRVNHYLGDRNAPKELLVLENRVDEVAGSADWVGGPQQSTDSKDQVYNKARADGFWEQGKTLYAQNQYAEALEKFRQSLSYWSNQERADYVRQLEAFVAQNRARAKALRDEAYRAQQQGNTRLATTKYRESLKIWPDRQLEEYLDRLERSTDPSRPGAQMPRDERFCGPVDLNVTVPVDFVITFTSGPTHAEWGSRQVKTILAKGQAVSEEIQPPRGGREPSPQEQKPPALKRISQDAIKRVYAQVVACEFFDLKENYWNQQMRDGGVSSLTVTANARTRRVTVYYYDVPRYDSIVSTMREEMEKTQ